MTISIRSTHSTLLDTLSLAFGAPGQFIHESEEALKNVARAEAGTKAWFGNKPGFAFGIGQLAGGPGGLGDLLDKLKKLIGG